MRRKRKKKKQKVLKVKAPRGVKVKVTRKKRNPIILQFGGQKRKFHVGIGRQKKQLGKGKY